MRVSPERVLDELAELAELTSDEHGAQRLTWSPPWYAARDWLRSKVGDLPVEVDEDEAGNLWAKLPGESERTVVLGSHLDSVPGGGTLDGCLGVIAGLEALRRLSAAGRPPVTVCLVDFVEEEGDQTGEPLLGSQSVGGRIDVERLRGLRTLDGSPLPELLRRHGRDIEQLNRAHERLADVVAYLEIHPEQSSVLEGRGLPLGVVTGTAGVERRFVSFRGRRDHTARPMDERADALMATARFIAELRTLAAGHGGSALSSHLVVEPNLPVIVADRCGLTFDVRTFDQESLDALKRDWRGLAGRIADEERVEVSHEPRWSIAPAPFDPRLVELAEESVGEVAGESLRLGSPQLHDAGELARAGVPTVMLFVQSIGGISHSPDEASDPEHVKLGVMAFDALVARVVDEVDGGDPANR